MENIFDFLSVAAGNIWTYGVSFLIVLSVLVFIHEWGHYIVARLCGVRVETFSIGFGKEIFGRYDKNGTRWKFAMIPLGGYVKMFGDTDPASTGHKKEVESDEGDARPMTEEERKVAFFSQPVWQRALIVFAGPAINFIFAILLLAGLYMFVGKPVTPATVTAVEVGGAADTAGFQPHDIVLDINGRAVHEFGDIQRAVTIALDTPMDFTVDRDGEIIQLTATPERNELTDRFGFTHERGMIGILGPGNGIDISTIEAVNGQTLPDDINAKRDVISSQMGSDFTITLEGFDEDSEFRVDPVTSSEQPASDESEVSEDTVPYENILFLNEQTGAIDILTMSPLTAISEAGLRTYEITADSLKAVGQIITGVRSATELGGIIRIGAIAGDMAQQGFIALITFTALLSINLGLINLFPIPVLDGGHLVFYAIESVKGSPVSERSQEYAFRFGLVVIIALMLFTNVNDIFQLVF